ncbi:hypothetical protein K505DRAFT_237891 [Melanomma pulvis-pyrius CBS 109.77]|uniref:Uncharacterized protein n=1 Tax=Melanomma pulvis-pyrius CBS 109.77 TaxID=1314802 RepID=A0A6A6XLG2_9PLEO|nr:hypothetical protein K505DRAFT_237891 [Melanomma pulvis-pyrius CBS 109.77]
MYTGLMLALFILIMHDVAKFGWETQMWRMSLDHMGLMTPFNLTEGTLYALRIPDNGYPTRFHIWGSSHQIMHSLVM